MLRSPDPKAPPHGLRAVAAEGPEIIGDDDGSLTLFPSAALATAT
jgi:hypothetical protein